MKIGIDITTWQNKRGFGRFTREIVKAVTRRDDENEYLLFADNATSISDTLGRRTQVLQVPTAKSVITAASSSGRRSIKDVGRMTRQVLRHDIDVFFFPAVYSYFPILNKTEIILTIHDMIPDLFPEKVFPNKKLRAFWNLKQKLGVWQSSRILTVSNFSKQQIVDCCRISETKVGVINESAGEAFRIIEDTEQVSRVLHRYGISQGKRFLLYVGGMSPHKNLRVLIQAFMALISDPQYRDVCLILVGNYAEDPFFSEYNALRIMVEQEHLLQSVIFTGFVEDEDLACLYNAASIFVLPSLMEGFGLPVVEAMACGAPVIASRAGSLPEIIGEAGRLFEPHNSQELTGLLKEVLNDPTISKVMKTRGVERARSFSWDRAATDLIATFNSFKDGAQGR